MLGPGERKSHGAQASGLAVLPAPPRWRSAARDLRALLAAPEAAPDAAPPPQPLAFAADDDDADRTVVLAADDDDVKDSERGKLPSRPPAPAFTYVGATRHKTREALPRSPDPRSTDPWLALAAVLPGAPRRSTG
ncbi:hypothetical protein WME76_06630 [Sorangium sp. So ce119]|uniref:hypothetical protein n=1 Tax=Sorangium sp. So ce119 TaxID=3133279 RepID=UPI003F639665